MDKENIRRFEAAIQYLPPRLQPYLTKLPDSVKEDIGEIRLRAGKPIVLVGKNGCGFLSQNGKQTYIFSENMPAPVKNEIQDTVNKICGYSVYSHQNDMVNGFLTIKGGHRVGICGTAAVENGCVNNIRDISSLNIRISKEISGCAGEIMKKVFCGKPKNIIIAGAPMSGKTTILRDIIQQISDGMLDRYYKCTVIDERCEIASGENTGENRLGMNTDVLSYFPKPEGIMLAVRTLSPDIVFCDEIGSAEESTAIQNGISCGVKFVVTAHASSLRELMSRMGIKQLLESELIDTVVFLDRGQNVGKVKEIFNFKENHANENCRDDLDICSFGYDRANTDLPYVEAGKGAVQNHFDAEQREISNNIHVGAG